MRKSEKARVTGISSAANDKLAILTGPREAREVKHAEHVPSVALVRRVNAKRIPRPSRSAAPPAARRPPPRRAIESSAAESNPPRFDFPRRKEERYTERRFHLHHL